MLGAWEYWTYRVVIVVDVMLQYSTATMKMKRFCVLIAPDSIIRETRALAYYQWRILFRRAVS